MTDRPAPWDGLTPDAHELQYNPQRAVPTFKDDQARRAPVNARAASSLTRIADLAYGAHPLHGLDLFPVPGVANAPVHVFLHGGYWRGQDKANFAFVAEHLVASGIATAVVNYELCPASTLDGTVGSALQSIEWIAKNVAAYGGDPAWITLSGHSAGAHLGAAALATDWTLRDLPADLIKGAVLVSGIYDPAPAARTTVNEEIRLTPALIARHDYERAPVAARCPVWIVAGGREPWHWIDQSYRYAHHLHRQGLDPGVLVLPGRHHFDILDEYMTADSDLMRRVLGVARSA